MADSATVPMISPSGKIGDVPQERVSEAVKAGFKIGTELISPSGKRGVVPIDSAHDAIKAGFQLPPPAMPKAPQPDMQESALGYVSAGLDAAGRVAKGFGKQALETMYEAGQAGPSGTYASGVNLAHPEMGPSDANPAHGQPNPVDMKLNGTAEKVGGTIENIAEFALGDSELAGATKLEKMAKVAKFLEEHPKLASLIHVGMTAARQGAVGTGQGLAHGEDLQTAATQGAVTGVTGGLVEGATQGAGALINQAKTAAKETEIAGVGSRVGSRAVDSSKASIEQQDLQGGLRNLANDAQKQATGSKFRTKGSIATTFSTAGDRVMDKSKAMFQQIDEATNGSFQPNRNALREVEMQIRQATSDEALDELKVKRQALEEDQKLIFKTAEENGVDPKMVDQARQTYRQASALNDLNHEVRMATKGTAPETAARYPNQKFTPEVVDAASLQTRLNKMGDRLVEALGDKGAEDARALADLAKAKPDTFNAYSAFFSKPSVKGILKGASIDAAKDFWGMVLSSRAATHVAKLALQTGASAAKAVPAIVNAMQIQNEQ